MRTAIKLTMWILLPLMIAACHATDPAPEVGFYQLDGQRISGSTSVTAPSTDDLGLTILVTVDTAGDVIAAEPVDNYSKLDPGPGLAAVRQWKFHPQSFDGKPVTAVGTVSISYNMPEIAADPHAAFPPDDPAQTEIALDRGACFGTCPAYHVSITGDGTVRFSTGNEHFEGTAAAVHLAYNGNGVLLPGTHTAHIDPATVAHLVDRFRAAHFFGLKDDYTAGVTDNPTQYLALHIGGAHKAVKDYVGTWVGMPQVVRELEDAVDAAAGTARWVYGDGQTLDYLESQKFDFHSKVAAQLAAAATVRMMEYAPPAHIGAFISGLLDRGAPLDARIGDATLGAVLLRAAASAGDEALFDRLAGRRQLGTMTQASLNAAFVNVGCSPAIAQMLVEAGADPRATDDDGDALNHLTGAAATCDKDQGRTLALAKTLVALGVPLETRSEIGWTVLMGCDSPDLARLLLAHGANPNARAKDGTAPILATDDDRVALLLLRAGADPNVRNGDGSVRDQAVKQHMPATLAWLDAHGVK
jgi:hypothetical protein